VPQTPYNQIAQNQAGAGVALKTAGSDGALIITQGGSNTLLNITAQTVVKTGAGRVIRFVVNVAGAAGTISDVATTGGVAAANLIATIPATVGIYELDWPVANGIVVTPGAAQVLSLAYA
jgi:hypothetical protein